MIEADDAIRLPPQARGVRVLQGGPVETGRGFVLHSADFFDQSTLPVDDNICLTATVDILRAIANGKGPDRAVLALGYAGWSPGQLDQEIQANGWLSCPADPGLLFDDDLDSEVRAVVEQDRRRSRDAVDRSRPGLSRASLLPGCEPQSGSIAALMRDREGAIETSCRGCG